MTIFLLDIEGTTTPIDFVYKTLFPCAREKLIGLTISEENKKSLREEHQKDLEHHLNPADLYIPYLLWLMDQDRKSTTLKEIQGKIWEQSYKDEIIKGALFEEIPRFFKACRESKIKIAIFSSGSVLAQKLLFQFSEAGNLSEFITDYFDTTTGLKRESKSYISIAHKLGEKPSEIHFISDIEEELFAAREAGMQTTLSVRPGNKPQPNWDGNKTSNFLELL